MIQFILNNQPVTTGNPGGRSLLDFIRKEHHLFGTKIGCREGDCGACTVLEGTLINDKVSYKTIVSCLTPLANVHGKHIVTVEGLNMENLSPVQQAMADNAATQCGFCTPGFVVSLTGYMLSAEKKDPLQAISGNICRCTGYKSIEKAARGTERFKHALPAGEELETMLEKNWLPDYFAEIPELLKKINPEKTISASRQTKLAGGTDLMVQQYDTIRQGDVISFKHRLPTGISIADGFVKVGAGTSVNNFFRHPDIRKRLPQLPKYSGLFASEQIRNMGTLAGNMVNASPIGDMNIMLLALHTFLIIEDNKRQLRNISLREFFIDYKKVNLKKGEQIKYIQIAIPENGTSFHFEKVSKRTYLDIASVNSAIRVSMGGRMIRQASLSLGGVAPVPKFMATTSSFLKGKELTIATLGQALGILQKEIAPIDDIRGSRLYKKLLARQLFLSHFQELYPDILNEEELYKLMISETPAV